MRIIGAAPSGPGHAAIIFATSSHDIVLCCISNQTAPPAGKTLVMLGTNDPNNQKLQKSLKEPRGGPPSWTYDSVS